MEEETKESIEPSHEVHVTDNDAKNGPPSAVDDASEKSSGFGAALNPFTNAFSPKNSSKAEQNPSSVAPPDSPKNVPPLPQDDTSNLFIVDTVGDAQAVPKIRLPQIRPSSPARSDSSDEVIFHGRTHQPRIVDDPVARGSQQPIEVPIPSQLIPSEKSWDDTSVGWVHRSKPGIGWAVPKAPKKVVQQPPLLTFRIQKERSEASVDTSAEDDYLENIRLHDPELLRSAAFAQRDIDVELADGGHVNQQFKSLSVSGRKERAQRRSTAINMKTEDVDDSNGSVSNLEDDEEDDIDDIEFNELSISDVSSEGEDDDEADNDIPDEILAALLTKQEELGLGSDKLLLFDGGVDGSAAKAAKIYAKEMPKKSHRAKGTFPSATLMADVLEQDPYGGFDVMDFERPSLRKRKGKGKSTGPELPFELSDSELQEHIQTAWDNDRSKKVAKKQEREELRAQGLLGGKDVSSKYGEGMTIWQIGKEFENFLESDEQERSLPPMDKRRRKMIHEIAAEFKLKTKSIGKSTNRYTKLIKTKTTTRYVENRFVARARGINMGFFPRMDAQERGKRVLKSSLQGGNPNGVRYRDGDIVGGAAPAIGTENRGRAMLEKMGWTSGMALGTLDNKGILEPIAHIVKNTKSGLG
jgi:hypothetical protein